LRPNSCTNWISPVETVSGFKSYFSIPGRAEKRMEGALARKETRTDTRSETRKGNKDRTQGGKGSG
jgi:hypothetical protein